MIKQIEVLVQGRDVFHASTLVLFFKSECKNLLFTPAFCSSSFKELFIHAWIFPPSYSVPEKALAKDSFKGLLEIQVELSIKPDAPMCLLMPSDNFKTFLRKGFPLVLSK